MEQGDLEPEIRAKVKESSKGWIRNNGGSFSMCLQRNYSTLALMKVNLQFFLKPAQGEMII